MATMTLQPKQVRFLDIAKAFSILASHGDKALDLALEVDDGNIRVLESNLHGIAKRLNGDPIAETIEALLSHPFHESPPISLAEAGVDSKWIKTGERGTISARFDRTFHGMKLAVVQNGPANYEGLIDGEHIVRGKFKKHVRERVEKEAAKRANA